MNQQALSNIIIHLKIVKRSFHHPLALMGVSLLIFGFIYGPFIGYNVKFETEVTGDFKLDYSRELSANSYVSSNLKNNDDVLAVCEVGEGFNTSNIGLILVAETHFNYYLAQINSYWNTYLNSNYTVDDNNTFKFLCENQTNWLIDRSFSNITGESDSKEITLEFTSEEKMEMVVSAFLLEWQNSTLIRDVSLEVEINRTRFLENLISGSLFIFGITLISISILITYKSFSSNSENKGKN